MPLTERMPDGSERIYSNDQWLSRLQWAKVLGTPVESVRRVVFRSGARFRDEEQSNGGRQVTTPVEDLPKMIVVLDEEFRSKPHFSNIIGDLSSRFEVRTSQGTTLIFKA